MSRLYRKKPVVIEAVQFDGANVAEILDFVGTEALYFPSKKSLEIRTLEGVMTASLGDWVIKGVKGELYPCKPDIFELLYISIDAASHETISSDKTFTPSVKKL